MNLTLVVVLQNTSQNSNKKNLNECGFYGIASAVTHAVLAIQNLINYENYWKIRIKLVVSERMFRRIAHISPSVL